MALPVTGFSCNLLDVSLDVHPSTLECGVHGEVHYIGVDAAVVVMNEHRVTGDLPACSKPAHTRAGRKTVKVGQEGNCQGGTRRKTVKVGQEGRLSRWDMKEDFQGGTRRKTVKVVSCSQTAIWLQLCLYERWSGDYCQFFSTAVVRKCVFAVVCVEGGTVLEYWCVLLQQ